MRSSVCPCRGTSLIVRTSGTPGGLRRTSSPAAVPYTPQDPRRDLEENSEENVQGPPNWQRADTDNRGCVKEPAGQASLEPRVLCAAAPSSRPDLAPFHIVLQVPDMGFGDFDEKSDDKVEDRHAKSAKGNPRAGWILVFIVIVVARGVGYAVDARVNVHQLAPGERGSLCWRRGRAGRVVCCVDVVVED